ncbi:hypothetical protein IWW50_000061 [Coemansia erecta]|nr:hypothetical protein IWW50_000061 [Coemansia erecta]
MIFSIGSDSNFGMNAPENNLGDGSKPNNLYGGSVRQQQRAAYNVGAIALQDLSPSCTAVFSSEDDSVSDVEFGLGSAYTNADSGFQEESEYMLEKPGVQARVAECCVERAAGRRRENYYYTMGKKIGWWPGGGDSAAGHAAIFSGNSSISDASSTNISAGRVVSRHAGADSLHTQAQVHPNGIALKSASGLLSEIFPEGVPSQGELKSGEHCIQADVLFRADGCQRPWHAFIVDDVLYVHVSEFSGSECNFRDAIMALMELAEDVLGCLSVIVALPRVMGTQAGPALDTDAAASLVRAFMYSGFELVSPLLYCPSSAYILVGYDAM